MNMSKNGLILGAGYVGSRFLASHPDWGSTHTTHVEGSIQFNWLLRKTWSNLYKAESCITAFPFKEGSDSLFREFEDFLFKNFQNVIILSSIGSFIEYGTLQNPIDEESILNLQQNQVKREQSLFKNGAIVLNLAGVYGIDRSPLNWLKNEKIQSNKIYVNLIHVDDIVNIIDRIIKKGMSKERYIVSDGISYQWEDIIQFCKDNQFLESSYIRKKRGDKQDRFLSTKKLLKILPNDYIFQNLYQFLKD